MSTNGVHLIDLDASLARLYPPPPAVLPALGEAPCSVNCHLTVAGVQVQLTLRGVSKDEVLARLERILERYARPESLEPGEGWCAKHGVQMKLNEKHGKQWWSHRLADGHWCKGGR